MLVPLNNMFLLYHVKIPATDIYQSLRFVYPCVTEKTV